MDRVKGKVAFVTGAARGQGRAHAVRFAEEGADIIAIDICADIASVPYELATEEELAETVRLVEQHDRRIVATVADVRDGSAVSAAVDAGVRELGRLDIVIGNAGIFSSGDITDAMWRDMIDVCLTGAWHTCQASIPHLRAAGGGSIVLTSSTAAVLGFPNFAHYVAAKHGVLGLTRTLANELAADMIRVNTIMPTAVNTKIMHNDNMYKLFRPDLEAPSFEDTLPAHQTLSLLPGVPHVEPRDIANAALFLSSEEGRYITGIELPVDLGATHKTI